MMTRPSVWSRIDFFVRRFFPAASILFIDIVSNAPTYIPDFRSISPSLIMIGSYYWVLHRPDLLGSGYIFLIGLFSDLLRGFPVGVTSLMLLLIRALIVSQRKFFRGKSFAVIWWAFLLVAVGGTLIQYSILALVYGRILDFRVVVAYCLMTVAFYPLVSWLLGRMQLAMLHDI